MVLNFFIKGIVIGLSIAAPVGPIGILCIRRSLAHGSKSGLATGLGAATADAAYGCVAGFGLTAVSTFLIDQQIWVGLLGGFFLGYLGIKTFLSKPATESAKAEYGGLVSGYLSTLFLTLTNPATILSFVAVFAALGLGRSPDYLSASALTLGVFVGSAAWWLFLSTGVARFRDRLTTQGLQRINQISGAVMVGFGIYAIVRLRV